MRTLEIIDMKMGHCHADVTIRENDEHGFPDADTCETRRLEFDHLASREAQMADIEAQVAAIAVASGLNY